MNQIFRNHHLLECLTGFEKTTLPLDLFLNHYFRAHKALGSKDRAFLAETIYTLVRWQGLLDYFCSPSPSWEKRLDIYEKHSLDELRATTAIPPFIQSSCPEWLFDRLQAQYGQKKALEICAISNTKAPATIRANPLKTTREKLLEALQSRCEVISTTQAPWGITFQKRLNYFELPEFKAGLFEVQDEGSQLLAELVEAKPGNQVLDYCAGSGGKTLAFAYKLAGKGQIFLHDVRARALQEGKKRLKRAGIQNAQTVLSNDSRLRLMKKKMDWILVDAPCSGTGTLRRNPDMKWRLYPEDILRLVGQQRTIFEQALSFLAPTGKIVYSTCSILAEENENQVEHFCKTYALEIVHPPLIILPTQDGADGFYGVVLQRSRN